MRFGLLGPLEAHDGHRRLPLGGPKQRSLLAILLLHANEPVSRDRLIDGIWGAQPPANPDQTLDTYASRLRKLLGDDRLSRSRGGYALRVEDGELDVDRFEQLVADRRFADALELWRGPALADLLFEPFASPEAAALEERRLLAVEERVDAELAAGRGVELVPELERRIREHPFRERLVGQLMLALYRGGRQAAALETFREATRRLADELGLEAGPALRELERRILVHDPTLRAALPPRPAATARRSAFLGAGVVAVAAAVAIVIAIDVGHADRRRSLPATGSSLIPLTRTSGAHGPIALPGAPAAVTGAYGSLWVADSADGAVLRADPSSGSVVDRIPAAGEPGSIVAGEGAIWAAGTVNGTIERIDPGSDAVSEIRLGQKSITGIAFADHRLWVADGTDNTLVAIDPAGGKARATVSLDLRPTSLVAGDGALWAADSAAGLVEQVDAESGLTLALVHVGNGPAALAFGDGKLWVANSLDSTVSEVDPATASTIATIPVGSGPDAVVATPGGVWVANEYAASVSKIDPRRPADVQTVTTGGSPAALATAGHAVWLGASPAGDAHRGGRLVLASSDQPNTLDPGIYFWATTTQFVGLAYDTLVTFAKSSGPTGLRLVPDLALRVPAPGSGGLTYRFRLRPGIRYSDGRLVRATDVRRAFERLFRIGSPGIDDYSALVGAAACRAQPSRCDLSRGVATNDRTRAVVFRLVKPDPDFLFKLTDQAYSTPLPPGVPEHDAGYRGLPGTGPYRIVSANKREVRFERNPFFREWSHAAQPDGKPDEIDWLFSSSHAQSVAWVEAGKADWTFDLTDPKVLHTLRTRIPAQLHANPVFGVDFFPMNTHTPPFDDVRVRRAVNYAVDRRTIAAMYGGAPVATPTCQSLIPGLVGYKRSCAYTLDPSRAGAYDGPDLARAKQLVRASRTRGMRIDVWGVSDEVVIPPQVTAYLAGVLRSLGYRVRTHVVRGATISQAKRRHFQISTDGDWQPSFPLPSAYVPGFFACGGGFSNGFVCDRTLDRLMRRAQSLQLGDASRSAAVWAEVDRRVSDEAYWVPTVTVRAVDITSKRLRGYQFHPIWNFLADQAWTASR